MTYGHIELCNNAMKHLICQASDSLASPKTKYRCLVIFHLSTASEQIFKQKMN